jgi:predicted ATPase/signal transduction histidine kinase
MDTPILIDLSGYRVTELLYESSKTLIYRGVRTSDLEPVVIKLLRIEHPSFNELLQFRNQYAIAKNFNFPGIIKTYSLENYCNSYALVMEDMGGISLQEWMKQWGKEGMGSTVAGLRTFLEIAIQIVSTLEKLYRHRIIHKDIKPANILIHPTTGQVKLIDFSIASLLPKETQVLTNPNVLEGTLAYLSPEQTGRMNRGIDYRTDFYSLGVTFYELLTGQLPFITADPMELVHCHMAKQPASLGNRQQAIGNQEKIPQVLSDIVMKLMAKNAEDRYQSALGLKHDLETCRHQLQEIGKIEAFTIATRDVSDRFTIPEKLYGREAEVAELLAAFDRIASPSENQVSGHSSPDQRPIKEEKGKCELMLVAGFSGIGKTVVVNEVHKPIVRQCGYFIKGKFDQFQRNIPFSAFVQAFRDLMGQLLSESDVQIERWQAKIMSALGENAQVIIDVIPELERIIGKQPPVPELSGSAAQNRFNLVFHKFIQVLASKEHPLVIFLDDLQWADSASLKLMQLSISETEIQYLLLIGAYRDNEVSRVHPLMLTLEEIKSTEATVNTITLTPLEKDDLNNLIAETLKCSPELALSLTQRVYQKTKGNPFFANQYLKALHQLQLIHFNVDAGYWQCDMARIKALTVTEDIVEFMALQLQKMPESTQLVLKLAACIGNQFDLATLAIVHQKSLSETAADLWPALQEGLIIPTSEVYKFFQEESVGMQPEPLMAAHRSLTVPYRFLHDRVQQAAYSLIPADEKQSTHLKIGQLLLENTSQKDQEEKIFEIINQFNLGHELILHQSERNELARWNFMAGRKAKQSTAYSAAIEYLRLGRELLAVDSWESQYHLTLSLYEEAAEVAHLNGNFEEMEALSQRVLEQAKTLLDTVKVYDIKIQAYTAQNKLLDAVRTGVSVLKLLGIEIPEQPTQSDFQIELQELQSHLTGKRIEDLIDLPLMQDPIYIAAMRILSMVAGAAYNAIPALLPLMVYKQVNLSAKYGNIAESTIAYAYYGAILCGGMKEIETGYQFGQLALRLAERFNAKECTSRAAFIFYACIVHWQENVQENLASSLRTLFSELRDVGALEFAGYCAYCYGYNIYLMGKELEELERELARYSEALKHLNLGTSLSYNEIYRQTVLNLLGRSEDPFVLMGESCQEEDLLPFLKQTNDVTGIFHLYLNKFILCYLFGNLDRAAENAKNAAQYLGGAIGTILVTVFYFYDSLLRLSQSDNATDLEKKDLLRTVASNQEKMQIWADHAPENFRHKFDLVKAEVSRVLGHYLEAIELYNRAISGAQENGYIQEEALANELAAKFYLDWNKAKVAEAYMQAAYYGYARWGAKAKVDDLEKCYPQLLSPILQVPTHRIIANETYSQTLDRSLFLNPTLQTTQSISSISDALDFASIFKVLQTLSSSIKLEELICTLMEVVLENTGSNKAALLLLKEGNLVIEGLASNNEGITLLSIPFKNSQFIPGTLINYVKRSLQTVILDNATEPNDFIADPYLMQQQPKSVLCAPLLHQGQLIGLLYLENNLTIGTFTQDRCEVIQLLCAQAAISLENARLYQQSQNYAQQLERSLADLQQAQLQLVQSEKMSALGNLVAGVAHEINNPAGFITGNLNEAIASVNDLIEYWQLYQEKCPNPGDEVTKKAEELDIEYLLEDLPKILSSMKMGCDRIIAISKSLRTFSRTDSDRKQKFNLHDGIDSTILILRHRLKANENRPAIEVVTNYGDLPEIPCFPGQLNQVFMNILANAIDALEECNSGHSFAEIQANPNRINIRTMLENGQVKIAIADNGLGMPENVKAQIFDHLFTTKSVGKGTGLGLAIARQIVVEKHGGTIQVDSQLGQGTSFTIQLPL